jgi:hypothetical protein
MSSFRESVNMISAFVGEGINSSPTEDSVGVGLIPARNTLAQNCGPFAGTFWIGFGVEEETGCSCLREVLSC